MSDENPGADRRQFRRRAVQFAVRYRCNAEGVITDWRQSEAGNVSAGGMFMVFGETLEKGQVLELDFAVPGRPDPIRAKGRVMWLKVAVADTMVQCGLEFFDMKPEDKTFLTDFAEGGPEAEKK